MTSEQIENKVMKISEDIIKLEAANQMVSDKVSSLELDIKVIQELAEDVHIMAINMTNMQKTLDTTVKKVEAVEMAGYNNYKDTKGKLKDTIIKGIGGAAVSAALGAVSAIIAMLIHNGGI